MNKEEIEELAFKDRKELANLNELDLLEIIEFLQLDRKQWINQYSTAHNDYVDLQYENQKYKEVIDKAIEYINKYAWQEDIIGGIYTTNGKPVTDRYMKLEWDNCNELLDILKEVE